MFLFDTVYFYSVYSNRGDERGEVYRHSDISYVRECSEVIDNTVRTPHYLCYISTRFRCQQPMHVDKLCAFLLLDKLKILIKRLWIHTDSLKITILHKKNFSEKHTIIEKQMMETCSMSNECRDVAFRISCVEHQVQVQLRQKGTVISNATE
jgi:hypothetical protein